MSKDSLRFALPIVLTALCVLPAAAPANAKVRSYPSQGPAVLPFQSGDNGTMVDPNGQPGKYGTMVDPNGAIKPNKNGSQVDPDGATRPNKNGSQVDPNGTIKPKNGSQLDPNG